MRRRGHRARRRARVQVRTRYFLPNGPGYTSWRIRLPRRAEVATAPHAQLPRPDDMLLLSCIPAAAASVAGMLLETEFGIYRPFRATGRGYPVPRQLNARHDVGRRPPP